MKKARGGCDKRIKDERGEGHEATKRKARGKRQERNMKI